MSTLYDELGIGAEADEAAIKSAYRRRTKETHPDRGGCREKFQRVQRAYDVLSDPERRRHYDATGDEGDAPDQESEDRQALIALFQEVVSHAQPEDDLLAIVREGLRRGRAGLAKDIEKARREKRRLENMLGRLSGSGAEIFRDVLKSRIADQERHEAHCAKGIMGASRLETLLETVLYRAGAGDPGLMADLLGGLSGLDGRDGRRKRQRGGGGFQ